MITQNLKMKKTLFLLLTIALNTLCSFAQDFQWGYKDGGNGTDIGQGIAVDAPGNIYVTGNFQGTVDFDPGVAVSNLTATGGDDIFISKSDAAGNFIWTKKIGGFGLDHSFEIMVDGSGNVYTVGDFEGTVDFDPGAGTYNLSSAGMQDAFILKLNSSGEFVWAKRMGAVDDDEILSLAISASGNIYSAGYFFGTVDFDPNAGTTELTAAGGYDVFVLKLDTAGNFIWADGLGGADWEFPESLTIDDAENVYVTGHFAGTTDFDPGAGTYNLTSAGLYDIYISKLDANGNFVFAKSMSGTGDNHSLSIAVDASGNIFTAGYFYTTCDFDPGAGVYDLTAVGSTDIFISKLDASGNYAWVKQIGGTLPDNVFSMKLDAGGNIYACGYFQGTVDFDPGPGTTNYTSAGAQDIFILKLDASGNFVWNNTIGGTGADIGTELALDATGNISVTGYFSQTVDFDPGGDTANLTSNGDKDAFVVKFGNTLSGIANLFEEGEVSIYPNPTSNSARLQWFMKKNGRVKISICDMERRELSRPVNSEQMNSGTHQQMIDVSTLPQGDYIAIFEMSGKREIQKFFIQR